MKAGLLIIMPGRKILSKGYRLRANCFLESTTIKHHEQSDEASCG